MTEQERIVTDVGFTLTRIPRLERMLVRSLLPVLKIVYRSLKLDSEFRNQPELRRQVEELLDHAEIGLDVMDDFERHKIAGHVVRLSEGDTIQHSSDFDILPLIRARKKAKNRRVTQ